jgi:DDE family transposase
MPYKANADRRHKIPKARYRVTNWPDYDAALVRRGSLTLWVTEEALAAWRAPMTGKRGGQPVYADVAIETGLALRLVFHHRCAREAFLSPTRAPAPLSADRPLVYQATQPSSPSIGATHAH